MRTIWLPWSCLMLILLLAAGLRLWNLADHGFGNIYYAAAVRSMASSWHNFLYASFDPTGFLMLDKPPFAFWVQAICVKLFGFNGLSLHLPQVIEGVLAVLLVYVLTRRVAGEWTGLITALVMALTPANVAGDRSNLPDSCLLLVLLLAAWVLLRAAFTGSGRGLAISMVLVGIAFTTKMIAAFVVLPVFYVTYWLGAPVSRKRRLVQLCVATAVVFGVSLVWPLLVDLTPAHMRPYVGDTQNNSALSLAFGMFGVERFIGQSQPPPARADQSPTPTSRLLGRRLERDGAPTEDARLARNGGGQDEQRLTAQGGRPGSLRLANQDMAGHITWLIPFAVMGLIAVVRNDRARSLATSVVERPRGLKPAARQGRSIAHGRSVPRPRSPLSPLQQTVLLWGGWFVTYATVYSFSNSPVHPYYLNMLAPPIAALVGIGMVALWRDSQHGWRARILLITGIALTAIWQTRVLAHYSDWQRWMLPVVLGGSSASVLGLLTARVAGNRAAARKRLGLVAMTLGLVTLLVSPAVWSATPALAPGGRMVPIADPALLQYATEPDIEAENRAAIRKLVEFLQHSRQDERYVLVVPDIHLAAPIIIETGEPVMAYGGFTGHDPILTSDQFAEMVKAGVVRYAMLTDGPSMGMMGRRFDDPIGAWVHRHGTEVPPDAWKSPPESPEGPEPYMAPWGPTAVMIHHAFRGPGATIYDCRSTLPTDSGP